MRALAVWGALFTLAGSTAAAADETLDTPWIHVLEEEAAYRFEGPDRFVEKYRVRFEVLTQRGLESNGIQEVGWEPGLQEKPELWGRVIRPDGSTLLLDPASVTESSGGSGAPDLISDRRLLRAPLPGLQIGAQAEFGYTRRQLRSPTGTGELIGLSFAGRQVRKESCRLVIEAPATSPVRWKAYGLPLQPLVTHAGGVQRLEFRAGPLAPLPPLEALAPAEVTQSSLILLTLADSWRSVASGYARHTEALLAPPAEQAAGLALLPLAPIFERLALIEYCLASLRARVRYTGLEIGDGSLLPNPPAETLRRGFGDCKDQAVLLVAALRQAGIDARLALVRTGSRVDVDPDLPALYGFDHAIVHVPGPPGLWIDPTARLVPASELPSSVAGRLALVVHDDARELTRLPALESHQSTYTEIREYELADFGAGQIVETSWASGGVEENLRALAQHTSPTELPRVLANYAEETYLSRKLTGHTRTDPLALYQPFGYRLVIADSPLASTDLDTATAVLKPGGLLQHLPVLLTEEPERGASPRQLDLQLPLPHRTLFRFLVRPPAGFEPGALPAAVDLAFGPMRITRRAGSTEDGRVQVELVLDTGQGRVAAAEFSAVREGLRKWLDDCQVELSFQHRAARLSQAGELPRALGLHRELIQAHPGVASHHTRYALALLEAGLGEPARSEARRATELAPGDGSLMHSYGYVLEHDTLGRLHGPDQDRAGAVAVYRRAISLDPDLVATRGNLAILLGTGRDGTPYQPGPELLAAIAEYQALRQATASHGYDGNLLLALFHAGRFAEARALAEEVGTGILESNQVRLASWAALQGADAAIQEAGRLPLGEEARRQALQEAGTLLLAVRRYPEGAKLLETASVGNPDGARLRTLASLFARARPLGEAELASLGPLGPILEMLRLAIERRMDARAVRRLYSRRLFPVEDSWDFTWLGRLVAKAMTEAAETTGVPALCWLDALAALPRPPPEGEPDTGQRSIFVGVDGRAMTFYTLREEGRDRLVAAENQPEVLGRQAWLELQASREQSARRWIGWAVDMLEKRRSALPPGPALALEVIESLGGPAGAEPGLAASVLQAAGTLPDDEALARLDRAAGREQDPALRKRLRRLQLLAEFANQRHERALALMASSGSDLEGWALLPSLRAASLLHLRRTDGLQQACRALTAGGLEYQMCLAKEASTRGALAEAQALLSALVAEGTADASIYNELAWLGLFLDSSHPVLEQYAMAATQRSGFKSPAILHTLATIYAEQGKIGPARQTLLQSLDARAREVPDGDDWYVLGRIAEHCGLPDEARRAYQRVEPHDPPGPDDAHVLAKRRLAILDKRTGR